MDNVAQFEAMSQQLRGEGDIVRDTLQNIEDVKEEKEQSLQSKVQGVTVPFGIEGLKKGGGTILGKVFEKAGLKNGKSIAKDLLSDPNKAARSLYKQGTEKANQALTDAQQKVKDKLAGKATEEATDETTDEGSNTVINKAFDDSLEDDVDDNPFSFANFTNSASDTPLNITKSTPEVSDNIFGRSVNSALNDGGDDTRISSSLDNLFEKQPDVDPDSLVQKGMQKTTETGIEEAGEDTASKDATSAFSSAVEKTAVKATEEGAEKGASSLLSTGVKDGIKSAMVTDEEVGGGPEDPVADVIEGVLGATLLFSSIFGSQVSPESVKTPFLNPTFQAGIKND